MHTILLGTSSALHMKEDLEADKNMITMNEVQHINNLLHIY
jgi:hypothetical protein